MANTKYYGHYSIIIGLILVIVVWLYVHWVNNTVSTFYYLLRDTDFTFLRVFDIMNSLTT